MKDPKIGKIKWKKGKTIVSANCYFCPDCEGLLDEIGGAGCSHNEEWTYFYQCVKCKLVLSSWQKLRTEDMAPYGWKKVNSVPKF